MLVEIIHKPHHFDRVDRVKEVVGQRVLPGDSRLWILGEAMAVDVDGAIEIVPRGFTTDGASVPYLAQLLTGWRPWDEPQRWGAILHDWLYCRRGVAKGYADQAFRATLSAEGASALRAQTMYLAVHLFGGPAYRSDQALGPMIYS